MQASDDEIPGDESETDPSATTDAEAIAKETEFLRRSTQEAGNLSSQAKHFDEQVSEIWLQRQDTPPADNTTDQTQIDEAFLRRIKFERRSTPPADNTTDGAKSTGSGMVGTPLKQQDTPIASNTTDKAKSNVSGMNKSRPSRSSQVRKTASFKRPVSNKIWGDIRHDRDRKVVGMKDGIRAALSRGESVQGGGATGQQGKKKRRGSIYKAGTIEEQEDFVRSHKENRPLVLMMMGNIAACKVMLYYLITLDTILACGLSVGLTLYWYLYNQDNAGWNGGGLDWVILGFAIVMPMSASIGIAFRRREEALLDIARIRSLSYQLYLAHCVWDWDGGGRAACTSIDWVEHTDAVLTQLVGIGDELSRFLSLPTASRSRHRMTRGGRKEAAMTVEVAYRLFDSLYTQRVTRLTLYAERLKAAGLGASEISRIRQYERFIGENVEHLRMVKMYRSPQALRSFARLFTIFLPPFYAPTYAQIAIDLNSLGMGIAFAIITSVALTALLESIQILEDPFVAYLTLDGIDVREEFMVLHWQQLVNTRELIFPDAPPFPERGRAAIDCDEFIDDPEVRKKTHHKVGSLESALSWGSGDERKFGMFDSLDNVPEAGEVMETIEEVELGKPLPISVSLRRRTSSYILFQDDVDVPPSTGSISGSERQQRRIPRPWHRGS